METVVDEDTVEGCPAVMGGQKRMWVRGSRFSPDGEVKCELFSGTDDT